MPRRREAVCDSLFCTLVVVVPVVTALIVYRNNVRQLLKILFVGFLLFGAFVSSRHLFFRAARQLRNYLWRRQSQEEEEEAEGKWEKGKYADLAGVVVGVIWSSHSLHCWRTRPRMSNPKKWLTNY